MPNKTADIAPIKSPRKRKVRSRRKRKNTAQPTPTNYVDFFDERIMEVIKYRLAASVDQYAVNPHDCTFRAEVMGHRLFAGHERQVNVRWHPENVLPDEWVDESKFSEIKLVPFRRIPQEKIRLLYPKLFPPERQGKAPRKWKPVKPSSPTISVSSSQLETLSPSSEVSSPFKELGNITDSSLEGSSKQRLSFNSPHKSQPCSKSDDEN